MGNLGVLPLSHSYALIVTGHLGVYRGHEVVVLPGFDIYDVLQSIDNYRLEILWMVQEHFPPGQNINTLANSRASGPSDDRRYSQSRRNRPKA